MPKLVAKPARAVTQKPARTPIVYAPGPRKPKVKIPDLVLDEDQVLYDTIGFSCAKRNGKWVIVDRYSNLVQGQPAFTKDEYEVARAYADALNEEITRRRFSAQVRAIR